ncbi:MAG: threonylcarbamoyl-AMP synthase [Deltaproteobacteria bacterium]|nr:threonylcarbamoyl-AMP synthase [Candidatus Zymogenaceae bacterium]
MKVVDVTRAPQAGIEEAVTVLEQGGVIVYPTDTLYGFGVDARNSDAVRRLREIKGRSRGLVFSVMLPNVEELVSLVTVDIAFAGVLKILPGPYTFIFPSKVRLSDGVIGKGRGLGVRIPDHPVALAIAGGFGGPVITTSVNRTGEPPQTDPFQIKRTFDREVNLMLDTGEIAGRASTVVSFMTRPPRVIRQGAGPLEFLERLV